MSSLGPLQGTTEKLGLNLVNFDWLAWHDYEHDNWKEVDTLIYTLLNKIDLKGIWTNNLVVFVGEQYIDEEDYSTWRCTVDHTTPGIPTTFTEDRAANPGRWQEITVNTPYYAGAYNNNFEYKINDFVS